MALPTIPEVPPKEHHTKAPPTTRHRSVTLTRHVYTQGAVEEAYPALPRGDDPRRPWCTVARLKSYLLGCLPIIQVVKSYVWREDLKNDVIAGLSTSFLQMPMGIAYSSIVGVPPSVGLYSSFFPVIVYLIFGTSRHISMGTQALISLMTADVIDRVEVEQNMTSLLGDDRAMYRTGIATAVSCLAGAMLLLGGLVRLGCIGTYLSTSFLGGFTEAAAVHIITSQVPRILNIQIAPRSGAGKLLYIYNDIFSSIQDSNTVDVAIGLGSTAVLLAVTWVNEVYQDHRFMVVPIPIHLLMVIVMTAVSHVADLAKESGIAVVGPVSTGFMSPTLPPTNVMPSILSQSTVIAVNIYALTIAMAKLMAKNHNYVIDDNQELVSYGLCNLVGSVFQCIPVCNAPPRSMLLALCGVRTVLNGVFKAVFILAIILWSAHLFAPMPISVLAAMIIATNKGLLMQVTQLPTLWRCSKPDFLVWVVTCLVGVLLDLDYAIVVGVVASLLSVPLASQLTSPTVGGLSTREHVYLADGGRVGLVSIPGVRFFYFPSQLHFANADHFKHSIYSATVDPDLYQANIASRNSKARRITSHFRYQYEEEEEAALHVTEPTSMLIGSGLSTADILSSRVAPNSRATIGSARSNVSAITKESYVINAPTGIGEGHCSEVHSRLSTPGLDPSDAIRTIVIDCSAMTYCDLAGINVLHLVISKYDKIGVQVFLARCPPFLLHILAVSDFYKTVSADVILLDVWDALTKKEMGALEAAGGTSTKGSR